MTIHTSKSTGAIEFLYGGCPFSETESRFISAVDWDISSKFGTLIDFHLLKQTPSLHLYPEVHFWLYGRRLENSIWRHISAADRPINTKFGEQMQNDMREYTWSIWKHGNRSRIPKWRPSFSETRSSYKSALDWDFISYFFIFV